MLARAASLASLGLLAMFATSGGEWPTPLEWLMIAFFPLGVATGTVLAWWREIAGGAIAVAGLVGFHAIVAMAGRPWPGPWFAAFAAPAAALLACGLATRMRANS
jgi:hypothetical protein